MNRKRNRIIISNYSVSETVPFSNFELAKSKKVFLQKKTKSYINIVFIQKPMIKSKGVNYVYTYWILKLC